MLSNEVKCCPKHTLLTRLLIFSLPYETISSLRAEIHSNHFHKSIFNTRPSTYQHSKMIFVKWMTEWILTFHYKLMKLQNTDMSLSPNKLANYLLERKKLQSRYVVCRMATYNEAKEVHRNCVSRKRIARQAGQKKANSAQLSCCAGRVNSAGLSCSNPARSQERPVFRPGPWPIPRKWALSP